jgi:putative sterol carrier protein
VTDLPTMLSGMTEEELDRFFYESDAELVVKLVSDTTDRELTRLLVDDAVRSAAVGGVLARLDEFAVPERLVEVQGTVCFSLALPRRGAEIHALRFGDGVSVLAPAEADVPDVTIGCDMLDFVRLVTGGANAALLHLADRLSIEGHERLALAVGGVFRVPGSDNVAVDPSALDPVDVAVAVAKVKDAHLRSVMAGGLREVILAEVFRRLPDFVHAEKARGHDLAVGFKIGGRTDGEFDRYVVRLSDGAATVRRIDEGDDPRDRDATLALDGAQFLKLVTGRLNPVTGVLRGQLKVRGDVRAALTFSGLMEIPSP